MCRVSKKRVREVDQTKAAHTAHGAVPGPAAFLQRGRLPTHKLALAPALGLDEPVAVRDSERRPVGLLAKTRAA